jgi:pimeloyl-ACP methyl ester carboxylesterase
MQLSLDDAVITYDYTEAGADGPPLLFLHGALGVRGQFDALRGRFPERSQLLLDFPSHGESMLAGETLNIERLAHDVLMLLDDLEIEQVDIIGYSMGGYVGIVLALHAPDRVRSIASHAMKFYWTDEAIAGTLDDLDADVLRGRSQRGYDALVAMHVAAGLDRTLLQTRSLIADFDRWQLSAEMVRSTGVPLLLSAGDRDDLVPPQEIVKLYESLDPKLGALAILPSTPHPFHHLPLDCYEHAVRRFWANAFRKATV